MEQHAAVVDAVLQSYGTAAPPVRKGAQAAADDAHCWPDSQVHRLPSSLYAVCTVLSAQMVVFSPPCLPGSLCSATPLHGSQQVWKPRNLQQRQLMGDPLSRELAASSGCAVLIKQLCGVLQRTNEWGIWSRVGFKGPVSRAELCRCFQTGELDGDVLIRHVTEGSPDCKELSKYIQQWQPYLPGICPTITIQLRPCWQEVLMTAPAWSVALALTSNTQLRNLGLYPKMW